MYQIDLQHNTLTKEERESNLVVGRIVFNNDYPRVANTYEETRQHARYLCDELPKQLKLALTEEQLTKKQLQDRIIFLEKELERYKLLYAKSRRKIKELNHV